MSYEIIPLYFVIGGSVVAIATHFGSRGKGLVAAFFTFFPSISVVSLTTIYLAGGVDPALSVVRGMIFLLPAWLFYGLTILYLLPRMRFPLTIAAGVLVYMLSSFLISRLLT